MSEPFLRRGEGGEPIMSFWYGKVGDEIRQLCSVGLGTASYLESKTEAAIKLERLKHESTNCSLMLKPGEYDSDHLKKKREALLKIDKKTPMFNKAMDYEEAAMDDIEDAGHSFDDVSFTVGWSYETKQWEHELTVFVGDNEYSHKESKPYVATPYDFKLMTQDVIKQLEEAL